MSRARPDRYKAQLKILHWIFRPLAFLYLKKLDLHFKIGMYDHVKSYMKNVRSKKLNTFKIVHCPEGSRIPQRTKVNHD